jgi:hypothetical protein
MKNPFFNRSVLQQRWRCCSYDELAKLQPAVSVIAGRWQRFDLVISPSSAEQRAERK